MAIKQILDGKDYTEFQTSRELIDKSLERLNWVRKKDWIDEYGLPGMPNSSEVGHADYILFGGDGRPLAVIEAKRTCRRDIAVGR